MIWCAASGSPAGHAINRAVLLIGDEGPLLCESDKRTSMNTRSRPLTEARLLQKQTLACASE